MPTRAGTQPVTIMLRPEAIAELRRRAAAEDRTMSAVIHRLLLCGEQQATPL